MKKLLNGTGLCRGRPPAAARLISGILLLLLFHTGHATSEVKNFSEAMSDINKYYVYDVSEDTLYENAIRGMMEGLDPHCAYLNKDDFRDLTEATMGHFAGVGLEVTMEKGVIRVITPLSGTPAQKAGIKSGDYIVKLDNTPAFGMTIRSAVNKMRGPVGSKITLKIVKRSTGVPVNITLKREIIHLESVQEQLWDNAYGYAKVSQFQASTPKELSDAIAALQKKANGSSLKGLILDLRNNPGGLLDAAAEVADIFLKEKALIVYTEGRYPDAKIKLFASSGSKMDKIPLVVLINGGSASAAEIVAGALKDNHRALLLGTKTFGKGSVQTVIPLDKESAIKLTTALYYTPLGVSIQAKGITPDIVVEPVSWKVTVNKDANENDITEADLQGHLASELSSEISSEKQNSYRDNNQLLQEDYVLYQALKVLQGMVLTRSE